MKVHHVGYFVKDIETAREDFEKLGWKSSSPCVFDEARKIFIQFMNNPGGGDWIIELVAPAEGCEIFSKRFKNFGSVPYHICYACENLEKKISELTAENFILIREPSVAPAIENRRVAFLYSDAIGQIELVENIDV